MVEFALILPLLMALLLGMVTGGAAYNRKISMTNAVREGARFGATLPAVPGTWAAAVQERTRQLSAGDLTTDQICVKLLKYPSTTPVDSVTPSGCSSTSEPDTPVGVVTNECIVKVWAQRTSDIQAMFFTKTVTQKASSVSRYEDSSSC